MRTLSKQSSGLFVDRTGFLDFGCGSRIWPLPNINEAHFLTNQFDESFWRHNYTAFDA